MSNMALTGVTELGAAAVTVSLWEVEGLTTPAMLTERRSPAVMLWGTLTRTDRPLCPSPGATSKTEPG